MAYASLSTEVCKGAANCGRKGKAGDVKPLKTAKQAFENYGRKSFSRTDAKPSAVCSVLRKKTQ